MSAPLDRLTAALSDRYRLERELGQGGMATVYLAEDIKHDRQVAIKVLKPDLAAVLGAERFVQEIKTTAALSHPHILPLFDSGSVYGPDHSGPYMFYVMPFIEGETIRDRLNRQTQLGVAEAVRITREVADALDYAHRHGVIHRDIKPENILLHDGRAMVMDFGIALAVSAAAGGRMTETGLSLGTPHYMSPEQATADKDISARSDVYSLATVLFEMLAGEPPHTGGSAQAVIMKIITDRARPVTELRRNVPPHVAAALAQALEKLPADRFDTARAFAEALASPGFTYGATAYATVAGGMTAADVRRTWLPWGVAAVLATAAIAGWLRRAPEPPLVRLDVNLGAVDPSPRHVVVSPDGSLLAVAGQVNGEQAIYLRRLEGDVAFAKIPGTENGTTPSFSPDGEWIVFRRNTTSELVKVSVSGGGAITLVPRGAISPSSPHWGTDEWIVFSSPQGTFRIGAGGGTPELLAGVTGRMPFLLPDGSGVLFSENWDLSFRDFVADTVQRLGLRGGYVSLVDGDKLLFTSESGALAAVRFDREAARPIGAPVVLASRVGATLSARGYSVARNGTLVLHDAPAAAFATSATNLMVVVTPGAAADTLRLPPGRRAAPRFAPDGRRIAYEMPVDGRNGQSAIFTVDIVTGTILELTPEGDNDDPAWSPDGSRLVFNRLSPDSREDLWVVPADGSGPATELLVMGGNQWPASWPRDDLILLNHREQDNIDLLMWDPTGQAPPRPYLNAPWNEFDAQISTNGRLAALVSSERGVPEIFVREFPVPENKWRITLGQSASPRWSRDGGFLWWSHAGGDARIDTIYRARVTRAPEGRFGTPEVMYIGDIDGIGNWDLHPDGTRFVVVVPIFASDASTDQGDPATARFLITLNWFRELRQQLKAPGR
ncbi:MAG: protein kinase [Gemmatimonadales bacterium]